MSVIKTRKRNVGGTHALPINFVCAYEPLPQDSFIETYLNGPDGRYLLMTQTIDRYQATADWAVGIADQMAWPIEVVPITMQEFVERNRERFERALAAMTDQERGALRADAVRAMAEVMRDCDDAEVRADAFDVLVKLGALR
ncbi:MAG: hypothetical protein KBA31_13070 [Alphaproteobacteria bacterium]|nr:hypothetical protein [Alphaproteobacteria bacterium]